MIRLSRISVFIGVLLGIYTSLGLIGCSKSDEIVVTGRVLNGNNNAAVSDAEITIEYAELANGYYSSGYTTIGRTSSASNGDFSFSFDPVSAVNYRIRVEKSGYFMREWIVQRDEIRGDNENEQVLEVFSKTRLKLHVQNSTAAGKSLLLHLGNHSPECEECCPMSQVAFQGLVDTLVMCDLYGDQTITYRAIIASSASSEEKLGEIHLNGSEVAHEILY